jgi:hypothetical protein
MILRAANQSGKTPIFTGATPNSYPMARVDGFTSKIASAL